MQAESACCRPQWGTIGTDAAPFRSSMKPVLLCLHGWGGSGGSFAELRAALHGTELEILTPDLPGFGAEHMRWARRYRHLAVLVAMLHDESAGQVTATRAGRPLLPIQPALPSNAV